MNRIELKADTGYAVEPCALGFDIQPIKPETGDVLVLTFDNGAKLHVREPNRWGLHVQVSADPH